MEPSPAGALESACAGGAAGPAWLIIDREGSSIMNALLEFIFPHRLHRLAYFMRGILIDIATYFLYSCSTSMNPRYFWSSVTALWIYCFIFVCLPRIRDVGMSGWWFLVAFVPIANILLALVLLFRAPSYAVKIEA